MIFFVVFSLEYDVRGLILIKGHLVMLLAEVKHFSSDAKRIIKNVFHPLLNRDFCSIDVVAERYASTNPYLSSIKDVVLIPIISRKTVHLKVLTRMIRIY